MPRRLHRAEQRRQALGDPPGSHPADQGDPPRRALRVEPIQQVEQQLRPQLRPALDADRVRDARAGIRHAPNL
jgi:hypothetical protein